MKITLVVALLSLVIGYLVGKSSNPASEGPEPKVSFQSSSRSSSDRQGTSTPTLNRREVFSRLIDRIDTFPNNDFDTARLHAWILQLQLGEIPEAISILLDREEKHQKEGLFGDERFIEAEMLLLLTRWYELNGESVLEWIRNQNHWDTSETTSIEAQIIADGYHRHPSRGLELALELIARTKSNESQPPVNVLKSLYYQAGRFNKNPLAALGLLDPNGEFRNIEASPTGDGFGLDSGSRSGRKEILNQFAKGVVDSGRLDTARQILNDLRGHARDAFDEAIAKETEKLDWPSVKSKIDQGLVSAEKIHCISIVDGIAKNDSDQAISWYLDQKLGENHPRIQKISSLIDESEIFRIPVEEASEGLFSKDYTFDFNEAQKWLESMEAEGEPVEHAWGTMIENALEEQRSDLVSAYKGKVSPKRWRHFENTFINGAISTSKGGFHGRELFFDKAEVEGMSIQLVREFGLENQLHEKISARNETTRQHLKKILAEME